MGKKTNMPAEGHVSGQSNQPLSRPAHAIHHQKVEEELGASALNGISAAEAKLRLEKFGRNDLGDSEGVQPLKIIIAQIANAMTMVSRPACVARCVTLCVHIMNMGADCGLWT
jgi:P-type Na+/K+ transporter